ncbi:MAG: nucleotidyltransferase domain-containing protein [bacterium]
MVEESVINIVKKYILELQEKGLYFKKVILYGSHAKGTAKTDSDIDIMLVSKLFDDDKKKYYPIVWLSKIRTENRIEPYLISEKAFNTAFSPLIDAAKYEGYEIVIN